MTEEQSVLNKVLESGKTQQPSEEEQKPAEENEQAQEDQEEADSEEEQQEEEKAAEPKPEEKKPEEKPAEEKKPEPKKQPERKQRKGGAAENVVLVGKKPTMSYVLAVVTQFSDGINDVHLKARGRSISRAVDVAEVVKNRFVQGVKTDVQIGTEEIMDENNNKINVSTIDIGLGK